MLLPFCSLLESDISDRDEAGELSCRRSQSWKVIAILSPDFRTISFGLIGSIIRVHNFLLSGTQTTSESVCIIFLFSSQNGLVFKIR